MSLRPLFSNEKIGKPVGWECQTHGNGMPDRCFQLTGVCAGHARKQFNRRYLQINRDSEVEAGVTVHRPVA